MRFILIYDFLFEVGGLEKLMTIHARYLKEAGYDVTLLFGCYEKKLIKQKIFEGLDIKEYGTFKNGFLKVLAAISGLNKLQDCINPDDILISYSFPANYTIRKFKNRKLQYINHFPNFLYLPLKERILWANNTQRKIALLASICLGAPLRKLDKRLVKENLKVFQNSEFTKKRLKNIYKMEGIVSYPPVSKDISPRKNLKILSKYKINPNFIFSSGRVIPDKRIDWLIQAFSKIKDKQVQLIIAGQVRKKYKNILEEIAKKLKVNSRIKFLGVIPKDELINLYSSAKAYVFSAPGEDFGLAPAEAISCATPCIVWGDGSGPCEQIIDGVNGYYARPYDINSYAEKIDKALNKKWDKKQILTSSKKFSEDVQKKIFLKVIKNL